MTCIHLNRKLRLVMTGLMVIVTVVVVTYFGSIAVSAPLSGFIRGSDQTTLQLLHVVFRHGPRTPADTYPNDPHVNQTFYPYGWGHVTNDGKRELFNIGTWLHKRYASFLDSYYQPDLVHAQATGVARTHMSLQTVLAAMFQPKNTPMAWNEKLNWQPIPIFSQALNEDTLLLVRTSCPRYFEAFAEALNSDEVQEEIKPYKHLFAELTTLTGMNITEPDDIQSLYLTLLAEQEYGLELPEWTKEYFPEKLQPLAERSYVYNVWTREMQKVKAGPFLTKMLNEMSAKAKNTLSPGARKLFIYAGHDSTVVNIMHALNIWERQLPRYSSMAIFELHKNPITGEHYVEIYSRNNPKDPVVKHTVPGCQFQCPLPSLIDLNRDVLVDSERDSKRCEAKNTDFEEPALRGP